MAALRSEAYDILELPNGADADTVRTAYKRLALKWHPDKHGNSVAATKKFQDISTAYKKLTTDEYESDDEIEMTMADMFNLFQHIFAPAMNSYTNGYDSSDYDDDDDDDDEDYFLQYRSLRREPVPGHTLTPEEIERNANELITEEEKEKRKLEKRRAKKKRQREKKRLEKEQQKKVHEEEQNKKGSKQNGDVRTENKKSKKDKKIKDSFPSEDEFDEKAAFFTKVVNKKKKAGIVMEVTTNSKRKEKDKTASTKDEEGVPAVGAGAPVHDPKVLRSRQLAIRGNQMANSGHYQAAIDLFAEAIKLDPKDFRFFGNRSYCYDRLDQYDRALRDADKAISIAPDWPKGYFRKGRALAGLSLYLDAETAFTQVLKLDRNCQEAIEEQLRVRTLQLTEMGFSQQQAQYAIKEYGSVQQALDSLLAGHAADTSLVGEVYMSDDDDIDTPAPPAVRGGPIIAIQHPPLTIQQKDVKMDASNPEGLTALWVGNVLREVTEDKLKTMFSKYGPVTSVRCLPDKYCAFINYKTKEAAGKALGALQGVECAGQRLLIKFPDNPITSNGNVVIRKPAPVASNKSHATLDPKQTGPVNGDECYFWRTTGCIYSTTCRYKHLPGSRGVDMKPWQKGTG